MDIVEEESGAGPRLAIEDSKIPKLSKLVAAVTLEAV
jgi:hypothetical protein